MNEKNYKSSEFLMSLFLFAVLHGIYFSTTNHFAWAMSLTILSSSYIIARALFKKTRMNFTYSGFKTSEFWWCVLSQISIVFAWINGTLESGYMCLCLSIIQSSFNISRGIVKSIPQNMNVQVLPI